MYCLAECNVMLVLTYKLSISYLSNNCLTILPSVSSIKQSHLDFFYVPRVMIKEITQCTYIFNSHSLVVAMSLVVAVSLCLFGLKVPKN